MGEISAANRMFRMHYEMLEGRQHTTMPPAWERVYRICLSWSIAICMMGDALLKMGHASDGR